MPRAKVSRTSERQGILSHVYPWGCSSNGRALALHARGTGIDTLQLHPHSTPSSRFFLFLSFGVVDRGEMQVTRVRCGYGCQVWMQWMRTTSPSTNGRPRRTRRMKRQTRIRWTQRWSGASQRNDAELRPTVRKRTCWKRQGGTVLVRAQSNHDERKTEYRTCRNCKQPFDPKENGPQACQYHPDMYTGGEIGKYLGFCRKSTDPKDQLGAIHGQGMARFWDCCGETEPSAPGCKRDWHRTYDD